MKVYWNRYFFLFVWNIYSNKHLKSLPLYFLAPQKQYEIAKLWEKNKNEFRHKISISISASDVFFFIGINRSPSQIMKASVDNLRKKNVKFIQVYGIVRKIRSGEGIFGYISWPIYSFSGSFQSVIYVFSVRWLYGISKNTVIKI